MNRHFKNMGLALILIVLVGIMYANTNSVLSTFEISPNPMEKSTVITVHFAQRVDVNITIENDDGTILKTIFSGEVAAGTYNYHWNRLSDLGSLVPNGKYKVNLSYETRYTSVKKTLILK